MGSIPLRPFAATHFESYYDATCDETTYLLSALALVRIPLPEEEEILRELLHAAVGRRSGARGQWDAWKRGMKYDNGLDRNVS